MPFHRVSPPPALHHGHYLTDSGSLPLAPGGLRRSRPRTKAPVESWCVSCAAPVSSQRAGWWNRLTAAPASAGNTAWERYEYTIAHAGLDRKTSVIDRVWYYSSRTGRIGFGRKIRPRRPAPTPVTGERVCAVQGRLVRLT
jgi:hypothetical protein